jgi:hypothetical protein
MTSFAATKTAYTASSVVDSRASNAAVATSAPASASIAMPMAPAKSVTVHRHSVASVRRAVKERRLARNGTRSNAPMQIVQPATEVSVLWLSRCAPTALGVESTDGVEARMQVATTRAMVPTTPITAPARSHAAERWVRRRGERDVDVAVAARDMSGLRVPVR